MQWYIRKGDSEKGPYTTKRLRRALEEGKLRGKTLIRREDESEWQPASEAIGMSREPALVDEEGDLIDHDRARHLELARHVANRDMKVGGGVFAVGLLVTLASVAASNRMILAWGAIVFGALQFFRGYNLSKRIDNDAL